MFAGDVDREFLPTTRRGLPTTLSFPLCTRDIRFRTRAVFPGELFIAVRARSRARRRSSSVLSGVRRARYRYQKYR